LYQGQREIGAALLSFPIRGDLKKSLMLVTLTSTIFLFCKKESASDTRRLFFYGPGNCSRLRGNVSPPTHVPGVHCALGALFMGREIAPGFEGMCRRRHISPVARETFASLTAPVVPTARSARFFRFFNTKRPFKLTQTPSPATDIARFLHTSYRAFPSKYAGQY